MMKDNFLDFTEKRRSIYSLGKREVLGETEIVELVEQGLTTGRQAEETVWGSLQPLLDAGADTIVLGCTHYPFLSDTIRKMANETAPGQVKEIIDPAPAIARHLKEVMEEEGLIQHAEGTLSLHSSGDPTVLQNFVCNL